MERLTKRLDDGWPIMDCQRCKMENTVDCTALGCRNLMQELEWVANYTRSGYMSKGYAEYYTWLALAAYSRIKELEDKIERKEVK